MVERYETIGGVCLNVGCIPSKALLHAARVIAEADDACGFGIAFGEPEVDLDRLRGWKDEVVGQAHRRARLARQAAQGRGRHRHREVHLAITWSMSTATTIAFRHCIIAAGFAAGDAARVPRGRRASDRLDRRPRADRRPGQAAGRRRRHHRPRDGDGLRGLGSEVTVVEMTDQLIPGCDAGPRQAPAQATRPDRAPSIMLSTKVASVEAGDDGHRGLLRGLTTRPSPRRSTRSSSRSAAAPTAIASSSTRPGSRSTSGARSPSTRSAAPTSPTSTRSATSPAARCSPTRRRTRARSRPR